MNFKRNSVLSVSSCEDTTTNQSGERSYESDISFGGARAGCFLSECATYQTAMMGRRTIGPKSNGQSCRLFDSKRLVLAQSRVSKKGENCEQ
jgi:hypothetical protein